VERLFEVYESTEQATKSFRRHADATAR
jgi:hypothetical protein